ncbi:hypothetical protein K3495_g1408 [Podosphaera aphanis]|nr:hypothetical protein K3495_g1408 [Podosphaera aphanis]
MRNKISKNLAQHKTEPLELISFDVAGPFPMSLRGNRYFLQAIDNWSLKGRKIDLRLRESTIIPQGTSTELPQRKWRGRPSKDNDKAKEKSYEDILIDVQPAPAPIIEPAPAPAPASAPVPNLEPTPISDPVVATVPSQIPRKGKQKNASKKGKEKGIDLRKEKGPKKEKGVRKEKSLRKEKEKDQNSTKEIDYEKKFINKKSSEKKMVEKGQEPVSDTIVDQSSRNTEAVHKINNINQCDKGTHHKVDLERDQSTENSQTNRKSIDASTINPQISPEENF